MKMLKRTFGLLAIFSSCALLRGVTAEGEGAKMLDSGNERLALSLLLAEHRTTFAARDFAPGRLAMKNAMETEPARYRRISAARGAMRPLFEKALQEAFLQEAERLRTTLVKGKASGSSPYRLTAEDHAFLKARSDAIFSAEFSAARQELVQKQRNLLSQEIRPSAEELEQYQDAALLNVLTRRYEAQCREPLWEENLSLLKKERLSPAIAEGRRQQTVQRDLVRRTPIPAQLWEMAETEAFLAAALRNAMAKRCKDQFCYPLFDGTLSEIRKRAAFLPLERVKAALPHHLDTAEYCKMIAKDPARHRSRSESWKTALPQLASLMVTRAVAACAPPDAFRKRLEEDPALRQAALSRAESLKRELFEARESFASRQLSKDWPELFEGKWLPEMVETERFAASGSGALPQLQGGPDKKDWLEETENLAEKLLREAFSKEVARLEAQRSAVAALYDEVQHTALKRDESARTEQNWFRKLFGGNSAVTLEEVIKLYAAETEKRSSSPLFPVIEREIEVRARAILQHLREASAAPEKKPEPKKPPKPEKPEKPEKKLVLVLKLQEDGDALKLSSGSWQIRFKEDRLPAEAVKAELARRMAEAKDATACQIRLLVSGGRIYYRTVSALRSLLKSSLSGAAVEDSLQP